MSELALTSQMLYIGLALLLRRQLAPAAGWALLRSCAVGFSGVLFGLKVIQRVTSLTAGALRWVPAALSLG